MHPANRKWAKGALCAGAVALAFAAIAVVTSSPHKAGGAVLDRGPKLDVEALKRIPAHDVLERATGPDTVRLTLDGSADAAAKIEAMEPDLRALVWLGFFEKSLGGRDGMHTFFFMSYGDWAPRIRDALLHAGLNREASGLVDAMTLFGPDYPVDHAKRETFFAWSKPGRYVDEHTMIPNDPNPFDEKMFAKARAYPTRQQIQRAIDDYVARTPGLAEWERKARAALSDDDRLSWLAERLPARDYESFEATTGDWPKPYRQIFVLSAFEEEMLNGGVHQFFFNSTGALAPLVVDALRDLGLDRHADAVGGAIAQFAAPYPVDTEARRTRYFGKQGWSDWDEKLNAPTAIVDDGAIHAAMIELAKRENILPR